MSRSGHCRNSSSTTGSSSHLPAPRIAATSRSRPPMRRVMLNGRFWRFPEWMIRQPLAAVQLLPALGRACAAARLLGGAEQGLRLVDALLLLEIRTRIRHDPGAGLHIHHAVLDERGAQHDAGVHLAGCGEIADRAGVEAALFLLELVDDLHGPNLRRAGYRTR